MYSTNDKFKTLSLLEAIIEKSYTNQAKMTDIVDEIASVLRYDCNLAAQAASLEHEAKVIKAAQMVNNQPIGYQNEAYQLKH